MSVEHSSEPTHPLDAHDSLFILRFIKTHIPIKAIITEISPTTQPDGITVQCSDRYLADLYEGIIPITPTHANATKQDIIIYNIDPNAAQYAIGATVTVWLMPDCTGIINPAGDAKIPSPEFEYQILTGVDNRPIWSIDRYAPKIPNA